MGKSSIRKRILPAIIMAIVTLNISMPVLATPNEEVNKKVTENQEKFKELAKTIDETQGKIYRLNTEIETIIEKIKNNKDELKVVSDDVEKSKKEIEESKIELLDQEEMLAKRLRELYKSGGQNSYFVMLLSSEGFTDFISKIFATSKMVSLDKKVISDLNEKQDELEKDIKTLEKKSNDIEKATESNEKALEELENKKKEQETLVTQMLSEQAKFDDEYLAVSERNLIEHQLKVLKESDSLEELHVVINQLIIIRDKQLKSPTVIQEINKAIVDVTARVKGLDKYLEEKGTAIPEGTLKGSAIVSYAYQFLGKPYVFGAEGPDEFDCSGFTRYVYMNTIGVDITRTTYTQIGQGKSIPLSELQLGDLVFTYGVDHVGIYVGGGSYIHSPQPGESIKVSQITSFTEGRRIIED